MAFKGLFEGWEVTISVFVRCGISFQEVLLVANVYMASTREVALCAMFARLKDALKVLLETLVNASSMVEALVALLKDVLKLLKETLVNA